MRELPFRRLEETETINFLKAPDAMEFWLSWIAPLFQFGLEFLEVMELPKLESAVCSRVVNVSVKPYRKTLSIMYRGARGIFVFCLGERTNYFDCVQGPTWLFLLQKTGEATSGVSKMEKVRTSNNILIVQHGFLQYAWAWSKDHHPLRYHTMWWWL